jgi:hypothetical protein
MGKMHEQFWSENLMGKIRFGDIGVDGRIILKRIFKNYGVRTWTEFSWLGVSIGGLL